MRRRPPFAAREAQRREEAAAAAAFYNDGPGALLLEDDDVANDPTARCSLCGKGCTAVDYCHGCSAWICSGCDHSDPNKRPQGGKHVPEAHRVRPKVIQ